MEPRDEAKDSVMAIVRPTIPRTEAKPRLLFSYPFGSPSAISITSNELAHLPEGVYLNDSLIDFDLCYTIENLAASIRQTTHIFSSFFYRKLSRKASTKESLTKINIFEKAYCLVPINEQYRASLSLCVDF